MKEEMQKILELIEAIKLDATEAINEAKGARTHNNLSDLYVRVESMKNTTEEVMEKLDELLEV